MSDIQVFDPKELVDRSMLKSKYVNDEALKAVTGSGGNYLPRLDLCGSNSNAVKTGKVRVGHYAIVPRKDEFIDVGNMVHCWVFGYRLKALDMSGDTPISVYNPQTEEYQRILLEADVKDSNCMAGTEFLLYLSEQEKFVTFYMASKTQRNEAPNVISMLGRKATLTSDLIKTKKYAWHGSKILECSLELAVPAMDDFKRELEKFTNPAEKEEVKETEAEASRVR